ncbi:hypothetical protein BCV72DRAFT_226956 [Rhizopus microsporus var. microsporus]|uniref:YEATS domain-containing protein n=1 Tax=Rhizopus microsporus var. microsporus TaxID=86635 RepID=A0A1X0R5E7_RHIZD|nr:hypothetical protein BCV72DRAFT_226956 [Rhizopus microsporus var. microsporus]
MSVYQDFKISSHNSVIKGASAKNSNGHPWRDWQVSLVAVDNGKEVKGKASLILDHVEYILHPTFENPRRVKTKEPYLLQEQGWGEFDLRALLHFTNNLAAPKIIVFDLNFTQPNYSIIERVEFSNASPELVQLLSLKPDSFHGLPPSSAAPPPWSGHRPSASASSSRHASSSAAKSSSANIRSDSPGKSSASSRVSSESQRRSSSSKSAPLQDKKPSDQKVPSKRITSPSELLRSSSGSGKVKKKQSAPRYSPMDSVKHKPSRADSPTSIPSDLTPSKTTSSSTKSSSPLRPVPDDIIRSSSGSGKAKRKQSSVRYPTTDPLRRKTHRPDSPGTDSYNDIIPRKPSASRSDSASRKASSSYDNVSRKSSAYSDSTPHKPSTSHSDSASHKASNSYDTAPRKSSSSYSDSAPHKTSSSYDTVPRKSSAPHSDSAPSKASSSSDAASRKPSASAHDTISRTPSSNQDTIRRKPSASNSNTDTTYRKSSSSNDNTASPADVTRSSSTSDKVKRKPSTTRYPSTNPLQRKPSRPINSDSSSDELGHIKKSASSSKSNRNPKASSSISKPSMSTSKGHNEATLPLNEIRQGSSSSSSIKHSRSSATDDQKTMPATNTSQTTLANEDIDVERIMDYFYSPESVGNIHLVHNNEVDELTRSAWDIPNIIISRLACRLSLLQGEHRNRMQEIIIANETNTMEFTVENGVVNFNLYSFSSKLIQALWDFTEGISYTHEAERRQHRYASSISSASTGNVCPSTCH